MQSKDFIFTWGETVMRFEHGFDPLDRDEPLLSFYDHEGKPIPPAHFAWFSQGGWTMVYAEPRDHDITVRITW